MSPATGVDKITGEKIDERLSVEEAADCERLETIVTLHMESFVAAGNALAEIRDRGLWRDRAKTFANYVDYYWPHLGKSHAYRLIAAAEVKGILSDSPIGESITTESQARPLASLRGQPEKLKEAAENAAEKAGGAPTAADLTAAAADVDPTLKLRREQEEARARARADKTAADAQAKAEAAVLAAVQAEAEADDPTLHATAENGKVRTALQNLLDLDAETTGRYCNDSDRRLRQLDRVEQWCRTHREALNPEGASLHVINGGAS